MREMKDSGVAWVGMIPSAWRVLRGKFILSLLNRTIKEDDEVITCFRDGEVTLRRNRRTEGFTFSNKEIGYQGIEPGDLVIHGMDGFAGAIGISDSRGKSSPVLNVCDTDENKRFIMYYLRLLAYNEVFTALSTGIRVRSCDLRWNKLAELPYVLPKRETQDKIVEIVEKNIKKIDSLITNQEAQIEKLKQYKQSLITEVVTKGLNPDVEMKDSGVEWIKKIPFHWESVQLSSVVSERKNKNIGMKETNLLSLSYGKLKRKDINTADGLLPESFENYNIIESGDIVLRLTDLQNDHTSLRVGLCGERGIITSAYVTLKNNYSGLLSDYLYYVLHTYDIYKGFYGMGAGVRQGLNFSGVKKLVIPVPSVREQIDIVDFLNIQCAKIDKLIEIKRSKIAKLNEYKKSLIYEYVTGKKEA